MKSKHWGTNGRFWMIPRFFLRQDLKWDGLKLFRIHTLGNGKKLQRMHTGMEMEMLVNEREMACEKTRSFELK